MKAVEVKNIRKTLQKQVIFAQVNLTCDYQSIVGIIGRNGSGKTVLFKCLLGFLRPDNGQIIIHGQTLGQEIDMPTQVGFIIETPGFNNQLSGFDNLYQLASIHRTIDKDDIQGVIERVGLGHAGRKKVGAYSMGMRQRLAIAQAIMENPKLLILDEPFNGLDSDGVAEIRQLLLDLKEQGVCIILTSHASEDIDHLCDTVYRIQDGQLIDVTSQSDN